MDTSDTSAAALRRLNRHATREAVFECIRVLGPIHDEDIAISIDMNPNTARPRRNELVKDGRVEKSGTGLTQSGSVAILWKVVVHDAS